MSDTMEMDKLAVANDRIQELERKVASQKEEIDDLNCEIEASEAKLDKLEAQGDAADAIGSFLDEVQRPVGTRDFTIPKTDATTRAIIGLYDAIGRNM